VYAKETPVPVFAFLLLFGTSHLLSCLLRNQEPIKGIAMMERQSCDANGMAHEEKRAVQPICRIAESISPLAWRSWDTGSPSYRHFVRQKRQAMEARALCKDG